MLCPTKVEILQYSIDILNSYLDEKNGQSELKSDKAEMGKQ